MRYKFALALPVVAALLAFGPSVQSATPDTAATAAQEEAFTATSGCSKQNAVSIALRKVGGGRVIQVVLETTDSLPIGLLISSAAPMNTRCGSTPVAR
jgi:hypothetical protein